MIICSVDKDGFSSFFTISIFFNSSSWLIEMAMTYSKMLNRRNKSGQTILIPFFFFLEKSQTFHFTPRLVQPRRETPELGKHGTNVRPGPQRVRLSACRGGPSLTPLKVHRGWPRVAPKRGPSHFWQVQGQQAGGSHCWGPQAKGTAARFGFSAKGQKLFLFLI